MIEDKPPISPVVWQFHYYGLSGGKHRIILCSHTGGISRLFNNTALVVQQIRFHIQTDNDLMMRREAFTAISFIELDHHFTGTMNSNVGPRH